MRDGLADQGKKLSPVRDYIRGEAAASQ
jgi:hypothetical protein